MRGERMPQRVRSCQFVESRQLEVFLEHPSHTASSQSSPKSIQEQRVTIGVAAIGGFFTNINPTIECLRCVPTDGSHSFLASLTDHAHDVGVLVPITDIQANQF